MTLSPARGGGFEISGIAAPCVLRSTGSTPSGSRSSPATAEKTCPVSKALAGTTITLDAALAD